MEPLVDLLRLFDLDVPMLGYISEGTDHMYGIIKDIIITGSNKYNPHLHSLAYDLIWG
jgi:hypothetical protein